MLLVYIETNFLLEIALLQDQHEGATQVVDLAEAGKITLALPAGGAFCV